MNIKPILLRAVVAVLALALFTVFITGVASAGSGKAIEGKLFGYNLSAQSLTLQSRINGKNSTCKVFKVPPNPLLTMPAYSQKSRSGGQNSVKLKVNFIKAATGYYEAVFVAWNDKALEKAAAEEMRIRDAAKGKKQIEISGIGDTSFRTSNGLKLVMYRIVGGTGLMRYYYTIENVPNPPVLKSYLTPPLKERFNKPITMVVKVERLSSGRLMGSFVRWVTPEIASSQKKVKAQRKKEETEQNADLRKKLNSGAPPTCYELGEMKRLNKFIRKGIQATITGKLTGKQGGQIFVSVGSRNYRITKIKDTSFLKKNDQVSLQVEYDGFRSYDFVKWLGDTEPVLKEKRRQEKQKKQKYIAALKSGKREIASVQDAVYALGAKPNVSLMKNPPIDGPANDSQYYGWINKLVTKKGDIYICWNPQNTTGFAFTNIKTKFSSLYVGKYVAVVGRYVKNIEITLVNGRSVPLPLLTDCYVESR